MPAAEYQLLVTVEDLLAKGKDRTTRQTASFGCRLRRLVPDLSRHWRRGAIVALVGMVAAGFLWARSRTVEDDAIREAVFRQQLVFWLNQDARMNGGVVCLGIEENGHRRSVTAEYLARVSQHTAVRALDECEERPTGAIERRTGKPAIVVVAGAIALQPDGEAVVTTRHYRSATISGVRTQRVVREGGEWNCVGQVINDSPL